MPDLATCERPVGPAGAAAVLLTLAAAVVEAGSPGEAVAEKVILGLRRWN